MLKELFEAVQAQAVRNRQDVVEVDKVTIGVRQADGTLNMQRLNPEPRKHTAGTIVSLVEAIEGSDCPTIWYSRSGVVGFYDDADRRDRVTMPLAFSPQLLWLMAMEKSTPAISQRDLIFKLRTLMKNCLAPFPRLIEILRQVDFKVSSEGASSVQHGKVSVGKQMRQEMSGAELIPEYVVFQVPIFASSFLSVLNIECALEPEPSNSSFQVIPIAGAIENAIEQAEADLGGAIKELAGEITVLHGVP